MKFLVTRIDAAVDTTGMRGFSTHRIRNSDTWPIIVEAEHHEDAVRVAYSQGFGGETKLPMNRPFLVVAMIDSVVVELKPKQEYHVVSRPIV